MPTLVHRIRSNALAAPGQAALFGPVGDGWRQLSWGAWWASIRQAAGGLIDLGVPPASSVVLWADAIPEWAVLWPAITAVGAVPVLLPPDADDPDLLLALSDVDVRHVIVGGRERMERLLVVREGGLELDRIVSIDRLNVVVPRMVDLDGLIERGAGRMNDVDRRVGAMRPTGIAAEIGTTRLHQDELLGAVPSMRGVGIAADPATQAAVRSVAAAVLARAELWVSPDRTRMLEGLSERGLSQLCLDPAGWEQVLADLEARFGRAQGVAGGLARISRGTAATEGPVGALARTALAPLLREAGLLDVRGVSTARLPDATALALRELGVQI